MGLFDSLFRKKSAPAPEPQPAPLDKNRFLIGLSESERTDFGRVDFDEQPFEQQVFSAIWALQRDVPVLRLEFEALLGALASSAPAD
jgi:hypothetical protein